MRPITKETKTAIRSIGFYFILALILIWTIFPFLYMVISSFKTNVDLFNMDKLFVFKPTLKNYIDVFTLYNFARPLENTVIVTCVSTVLCLLLGVPAAYSIARFKQRFFSTVILAVRIIPGIAFLVPWYVIFTKLGMNGSYVSLILCHMLIGLPMIVWVMIPYFEKLPRDLEESAMVDGCTRLDAFLKIMLPLSVPGLITATLLTFIGSWNNFIFGLILGTSKTQPLPVAVFSFISYTEVNWGGMMAASVVITLPIIVICMLLQKYIISGLTAGAVKG
ncbi:MAG: carbohydrate ABC transporter permease [Firmicutes bacterium]|nr:carbohydrate ABC transporter permease [Bacillota bacterium]